ncbi:MAG: hypothetical protein A2138_17480 [Deltaproteobacteria bacterium RBG_16_71_12]|nr:MAG: hypothetical protein A2138_17480 [Deltaproteobacteria bacterium RBG_16_71_12]
MLSLLLLSSLAAAEPLKVLVLDLQAENVPTSTARIVRDEIAVEMGRDERLDVLSTEDLRRVVSVEVEKKALGCDEQSCLSEMGQALGARYIVHGSVALLGSTTIIHLNLFDTEASRSVARETSEAKSADQLLPELRTALTRIRARMLGAPAAPAMTVQDDAGLSGLAIVGGVAGGVGVLVLGAGAVMMGMAAPTFYDVTPPEEGGPEPADRAAAQGTGQVGTGLLVGGALVGVIGGAMLALGVMQ